MIPAASSRPDTRIQLYHEVFEGNTAEIETLISSLQKVLARFPIKRVIAVADRGLMSLDKQQDLQSILLPGGQPLEFILAVPGRRYAEFAELLAPLHQAKAQDDTSEQVHELAWNDLRLIVAHLLRIIRVDLKSELFTYDINADARAGPRMDCKLLLTSRAPSSPACVLKKPTADDRHTSL